MKLVNHTSRARDRRTRRVVRQRRSRPRGERDYPPSSIRHLSVSSRIIPTTMIRRRAAPRRATAHLDECWFRPFGATAEKCSGELLQVF